MFTLLQAAPGASTTPTLVMFGLMLVVIIFFIIMPQRKQQKAIEKFRNSLTIGSKVLLASGVHGVIKSLNEGETYVTVEIAKGVSVQVERTSVFEDSVQIQQKA